MRILVTGGSGVLGSQVVERLRAAGQRPIVLSRRASSAPDWVRGDIATGEGLPEALAGVEVVVHAASAAAEFTKIKGTDIEGPRDLGRVDRARLRRGSGPDRLQPQERARQGRMRAAQQTPTVRVIVVLVGVYLVGFGLWAFLLSREMRARRLRTHVPRPTTTFG